VESEGSLKRRTTILQRVFRDHFGTFSAACDTRQFVFTLPKALRVFLRHDQRLFAMLSRVIFSLIAEFYDCRRSPLSCR